MSSDYLPPSQRPATGLFRPNGSANTRFVNSPVAQQERRRQANYELGARSRNRILRIPHANYQKMVARLPANQQTMAKEMRNDAFKNRLHAFEEQSGKMPGTLYMPGAYGNKAVANTRGQAIATKAAAAPASVLHAPSVASATSVAKGGRRRVRGTRRVSRSKRSTRRRRSH